MQAVLLIIRGLQELDSLFICFGMDGAFCGARPQEGGSPPLRPNVP
jgi:hypothetical protein